MEKLQHFCASCESAMDTDSAGLLRRRMVVVRRLVISNRDFLVSLLLPLPLLTPLTASASSLLVSIEYVAVGQQAICASIIRARSTLRLDREDHREEDPKAVH